MNRQRGMASLVLVLLLLVLGTLLLSGLNQQQRALARRVMGESRVLRDAAEAHSTLEWGRAQRWRGDVSVQCRQAAGEHWHACLRIFADGSLLLMATGESTGRWLAGQVVNGAVVFSPHGWSDFCPLTENALCQPP